MSVRQIDEALRLWRERLNAAAQNLIDLQAHPVYKRISAPDANLAGETAERSALAVRTLGWLLQYFDSLQGVISQAEELRRTMPALFGTEDREREIAALLNGRTVQLPAVQVPFGQRTLLGGMQNVSTISPAELLRAMESAFEQTKQIVLQLDAAWEQAGRSIDSASQRLQDLRQVVDQLTITERAALDQAGRNLEASQQAASQDPLGASAQLVRQVNAAIDQLTAKVDEIRRHQAQMRAELAAAQQLRDSLEDEYKAVQDICAEAKEKTGFSACLSPEKVAGLLSWYARLREAAASGGNGSVPVGLRNWTQAARQTLQAEQAAAAEARRQLSLRHELRGRLDALKAKARAYSVAENDELQRIAERAKTLLYGRPTPLAEASTVVAEYEARLNLEAEKRVRI